MRAGNASLVAHLCTIAADTFRAIGANTVALPANAYVVVIDRHGADQPVFPGPIPNDRWFNLPDQQSESFPSLTDRPWTRTPVQLRRFNSEQVAGLKALSDTHSESLLDYNAYYFTLGDKSQVKSRHYPTNYYLTPTYPRINAVVVDTLLLLCSHLPEKVSNSATLRDVTTSIGGDSSCQHQASIDCTDAAENITPRSFMKPSLASSAATSRSDR
jgi:hypothetical protein